MFDFNVLTIKKNVTAFTTEENATVVIQSVHSNSICFILGSECSIHPRDLSF